MTEKQFMSLVKSMKKDMNEFIERECRRLFNSGAIDPQDYDAATTQYILPKIILTVALQNAAWQYAPLNPRNKAAVKNLKHF